MGRVRVDPTDWPLEFHLKLMGAYRWLPMAIALKRRLLATVRGGSNAGSATAPKVLLAVRLSLKLQALIEWKRATAGGI